MKRKIRTSIPLFILLLFLILDTKTAIYGAKEGIELCLYTVIPSLFPFFILSTLLCGMLTGQDMRFLRPVGKLCGIPRGVESILLLGLLGGYPVGAQCIRQAYTDGNLSKEDARRMLGFCNNAGPSFIFGMVGCLFGENWVPWALWLIHIGSALLVGILLPGKAKKDCTLQPGMEISFPGALEKSIRSMANVCGWVITFRVILYTLQHWVLWILPTQIQAAIIGLMELTNGCVGLSALQTPGLRFVFASGILGFGGLCVAMQTASATKELGFGMYFPGKILQSIFSIFSACILQSVLFQQDETVAISPIVYTVSSVLVIIFVLAIRKITVDFPVGLLYNTRKSTRKGSSHAVSEEASPLLQLLRIRHKAQ